MATAIMTVKIWSGVDLIFDRDIEIKDGDKDSIRPAILGWNQQMYDDAGVLLSAPPLGPPDESIEVKIEYEISYEGVGQIYYHQVVITSKRFIVIAGLLGMRVPVHKAVVNFIEEYFVS